ncbi:amidohydrolase [Paenibacillus mendelii]|nr:amidohydrolase [Paenibacillus mendelii]
MKEQIVAWRRHFHRYPELSFQEVETARFVTEHLTSFGNLIISHPTPTSVVARLIGSKPGPVLAIRADMDALPIQEENTFEFTSERPGVMHACGHDGHTAMLLAAAQILSKQQAHLQGEIRFIFQHAEEQIPGGAQQVVDAGALQGVDWIIGMHLLSWIEIGRFGIAYGPMMASMDNFHITIHGRMAHAAYPHQSVDPIAIGTQVVSNLQHIVARYNDPTKPLVVSVTQFHGGTANNVIPSTVEISGTFRTLDPQIRAEAPVLMERIIRGVTEAHGASYAFRVETGYRPLINDHKVTQVMEEVISGLYGREQINIVEPAMGGEDFSAYAQKAPGTFIYIGAANKDKGITYPHHHPRFTIDEDALTAGVKLAIAAAFRFLNEGK